MPDLPYVRPRLTPQDTTYRRSMDAETLRDLAVEQALRPKSADLAHGVIGQLARAVQFAPLWAASGMRSTAFGRHVGEVVRLRADEEMVWADA